MDTRVIVERIHPGAQLPLKAHPSDACYDLMAYQDQVVEPGSQAVIALGISLEMEGGWEAQIRGRSGLAKRGIVVHCGTIDHLYRLELKVLVHNHSPEAWRIHPGDRIAQMKISRVWDVEIVEGEVSPTDRGGLGSTGR